MIYCLRDLSKNQDYKCICNIWKRYVVTATQNRVRPWQTSHLSGREAGKLPNRAEQHEKGQDYTYYR